MEKIAPELVAEMSLLQLKEMNSYLRTLIGLQCAQLTALCHASSLNDDSEDKDASDELIQIACIAVQEAERCLRDYE
jgi:hypothetical protein